MIVVLALVALTSWRVECETVSYRSGGDTVQAQLCMPSGNRPHPALVLIHPVTGLSSWVRDQGERLAAEGYLTIAIDLYRGRHGTDGPSGFARIGVMGWCAGGSLALTLAQSDSGLRVAIIRYPTSFARQEVVSDSVGIARIGASVLGVFGAKDSQVPMDNVRAFERMMKRLAKDLTSIVYPEADHGFELPGSRPGRSRQHHLTT